MRSLSVLGTLASLVLCACDLHWSIVAKAPIAYPLSDACIRATFDTIAHPPRVTRAEPDFPLYRGTAYVSDMPYSALLQRQLGDNTTVLEVSVGRTGSRFGKAETESVGHQLGATLIAVRDACGGMGVAGAAPYEVKQKRGR